MGAPMGNRNAAGSHKTLQTSRKKIAKYKIKGRRKISNKLMAKVNPKKQYFWK